MKKIKDKKEKASSKKEVETTHHRKQSAKAQDNPEKKKNEVPTNNDEPKMGDVKTVTSVTKETQQPPEQNVLQDNPTVVEDNHQLLNDEDRRRLLFKFGARINDGDLIGTREEVAEKVFNKTGESQASLLAMMKAESFSG